MKFIKLLIQVYIKFLILKSTTAACFLCIKQNGACCLPKNKCIGADKDFS